MKKSLIEAFESAKQESAIHKDINIKVMDKKGKSAIITASDYVYRERVLEGYYTVAIFRNGQEVK